MWMHGRFDLPDGVKELVEPVGWECEECGGRVTMPDLGALRFPDLAGEALQQSAAHHLASHGLKDWE